MKRILCSVLLMLCLLTAMCPITSAASSMKTSDAGIAFIKEMQNGTSYNLSSAENAVNAFIDKYNLSLKQTQFDALVDLVVAYSTSMLSSGYRVETLIGGGNYTDAELASAFCSWVKGADGSVSETNLRRRLREVKLFLYDSYDGNCDAQFRYVIFNPTKGSLIDNSVICYPLGKAYGNLPVAQRSGYYFDGWYTTASGGQHLTNGTTVSANLSVYAHWSETKVDNPNDGAGFEPPVLKISENCINFIKEHEGFSKYAYWDYSQYTIGYGTRCDPSDYPDGISEEEADYLLRVMLKDFETTVDKALAKGTVKHSQQQYDAIISFTFNLGPQWIKSSNRIYQYILFGHPSELDFVNAMGAWANAGGSLVQGLMKRRMAEADMYLNGNYERYSTRYFGAALNGGGGTPESKCKYYRAGEALGTLPKAAREGYELLGWYDSATGGTRYTTQTIAPTGTKTFYAVWKKVEGDTTKPTDPTESTEPDTSAPTESTPPETVPPTESTEATEPSTQPDPQEGFLDVPGDAWYADYVAKAVAYGLFSGMSETEFAPEGTMTRAMLVSVIFRQAGSPEGANPSPFTDVVAGEWYSPAVHWAYENGVVSGVSETLFGVEHSITREQLVTMLYRYAASCGCDISKQADLSSFSDSNLVSEYALDAMRWAVSTGILSGSDGQLLPQGNATRAQCAKIMVDFLKVLP